MKKSSLVPAASPAGRTDPSRDWIVTETLDRISDMRRFNGWLFDEIRPYLGRRVLEIGSGIGNFSHFLASRLGKGDLLVLSDISDSYLANLRQKFGRRPDVLVEGFPMEHLPAWRFRELGIDTVVSLNVLEHIADDAAALRDAARVLAPGGQLVLLVPAFPALYCEFDRLLGHHRRYTKKQLLAMVKAAGLEAETCRYFNFLGSFGWFLSGKVARCKVLPRPQLRLYDALVPVIRRLERWIGPPWGLSVLLAASKPPAETPRKGTNAR